MSLEGKTQNLTRRHSREMALKSLFQEEFSCEKDFSRPPFCPESQHKNDHENPSFFYEKNLQDNYTKILVKGVKKNKEKIDNKIRHLSQSWKKERMSLVDLNILRLAFYEIEMEKIPLPIAINEALDISKKYSTQKSSSFINGILDQAIK